MSTVPFPLPPSLDPTDSLAVLQARVRRSLLTLPSSFEFNNPLSGISATDLFNLNALLGAGIENEVVRTLNRLRNLWDPDGEWAEYRFERSSQAFPDVRLVNKESDDLPIAIGVELKGWWLLAKEGVPSLRYQVSPAACAPHDLICVVPWHLSNAVSGVAEVITPWVESARYAAEYRDHWWKHVRVSTSGKNAISYPANAHPYPSKADLVSARPEADNGGNFGRLPRAKGLMDDFIEESMAYMILGIPARDWVVFLKCHSDTATPEEVTQGLQRELKRHLRNVIPVSAERLMSRLSEIGEILAP